MRMNRLALILIFILPLLTDARRSDAQQMMEYPATKRGIASFFQVSKRPADFTSLFPIASPEVRKVMEQPFPSNDQTLLGSCSGDCRLIPRHDKLYRDLWKLFGCHPLYDSPGA